MSHVANNNGIVWNGSGSCPDSNCTTCYPKVNSCYNTPQNSYFNPSTGITSATPAMGSNNSGCGDPNCTVCAGIRANFPKEFVLEEETKFNVNGYVPPGSNYSNPYNTSVTRKKTITHHDKYDQFREYENGILISELIKYKEQRDANGCTV